MREELRVRYGPLLVLCLALASALTPPVSHAQVLYGTIVGNVKDASQAAVPGATVTVINPQTNVSRDTITSESGTYTVSNVLPGTYTVKVSSGSWSETQTFRLKTDPRLLPVMTDAEGAEQLRLAREVGGQINELYTNLGKIRDVKTQAAEISKTAGAGSPHVGVIFSEDGLVNDLNFDGVRVRRISR